VFNLVRHLAASDDIDFLALDDGRTPEQDVQDLRDVCAHVHIVVPKKRKFLEDACLVAGNMVRGEPFYTKYVDYAELKARLRALTRATRYDIIHFEHSHMAGLLAPEPCFPRRMSCSTNSGGCPVTSETPGKSSSC
jgi:hypothetical protein